MSTTMICLVGEQAIPNIIGVFLCQEWIQKPDRVICLVSEDLRYRDDPARRRPDPEFMRVYSGIFHSLNDLGIEVDSHGPVSPYKTDEVVDQVKHLVDTGQSNESFIVNITGGTKLMALGSYVAARLGGEDKIPTLYVDTEDKEVIWWGTDGKVQREGFNYDKLEEVDVRHYLQAYAIDLRREGETRPPDFLVDAARIVATQPGGVALMNTIAEMRLRKETVISEPLPDDVSRGEPWEVIQQLADVSSLDVKLSEKDGTVWLTVPTRDQRYEFFWNRYWLELYVFDQACQAGVYNDVRLDATVDWEGFERTGYWTDNQLDVVASRGDRLTICECKTGKNALKPEHLYKLQVIGKRAGTFVDRILVTDRPRVTHPDSTDERRSIVRALSMDILVVGADELRDEGTMQKILADPEKQLDRLKHDFGLLMQ